MSDELKEEMKKLREEMAGLKERLENATEHERNRRHGIFIDIDDRMRQYMGDVMESVAEGIQGELDKCVFIGPRGVRIFRENEHRRESEQENVNFAEVARVMGALGEEHRVKILKELVKGGKYINELQEKLPEITTSTLSSHLNVLEEAGLVVQEKVRGRYLITMPGRTAYEMATRITRSTDKGDNE